MPICETCQKRLEAFKDVPYPTPATYVFWPDRSVAQHLCGSCGPTILASLDAAGTPDVSHAFISLTAPPIYISCRDCGRLNHGEAERERDTCDATYLDRASKGEIVL